MWGPRERKEAGNIDVHNILPWSVATIFSDPPLRRNRASLSRVADTLPFGKNLSDSVREF